jgi:hypothetical protein
MHRTAKQTACLLAVILKRSEQNRARVSAKTLRILSKRKHLRSAFVVEVISELADGYDWILFELSTGGYGAVQAKTLEAAKVVTVKRLLTDQERRDLRRGVADFEGFEQEAAPDDEPSDEDDD